MLHGMTGIVKPHSGSKLVYNGRILSCEPISEDGAKCCLDLMMYEVQSVLSKVHSKYSAVTGY